MGRFNERNALGSSVQPEEVDPSGAAAGEALSYDGANVLWQKAGFTDKFTVSEVSHSLASGEYVALARFTMPTGTDLKLYTESVANDAFNAPAGLNFVVRSVTDAANAYTSSVVYNEGSPISTVTGIGGDDIIIALDNGNFTAGTGATQIVTGHGSVRIV